MNQTEIKVRPDIPTTTSLFINYVRATVRELTYRLPFLTHAGRVGDEHVTNPSKDS